MAHEALRLRRASRQPPADLTAAVNASAQALEEAAAAERPNYSKTDAAAFLGVSRPTLDKWIHAGLLPVEHVPGRKTPRIPSAALMELAGEIEALRELGKNRGLLEEALRRLHHEEEFAPLFEGDRLNVPPAREDAVYVSAAPGPDWDPDDEWDVNALDFDEDD
jgi:excisionase family DNA binding protein